MERFPDRLRQELENLLQTPDIWGDYPTLEAIINHAKRIVGIESVPAIQEEPDDTIRELFSKLNDRRLISLYLRLCEDNIISRINVNEILSQVRQEFIEYNDELVWIDHGIQELKEGIKEAVDILEALGFNTTKNELRAAWDDFTRGVWDSAVWRASKSIEGVCKEVARRYQGEHRGNLDEPWDGMYAVQSSLKNLGYWSDSEILRLIVDFLRVRFRNPTSHFDEDQTGVEDSRVFTEESAYIALQLAHLISLSMLRRIS